MTSRKIDAYWFFFPVTFDLSKKTGIVDHSRWQYVYFTWLLRLLTKFGLPIMSGKIYAFPSLHIYDPTATEDEYREIIHMIRNTNHAMEL